MTASASEVFILLGSGFALGIVTCGVVLLALVKGYDAGKRR